jgi:hypothetical protein
VGFISHALVQVLPTQGELIFKLSNENIRSYSELHESTVDCGGTLLRIFISNTRTVKGPTFTVTGKYITDAGFEIGNHVIAKFEQGLITIRKMSDDLRLLTVSKRTDRSSGLHVPNVCTNASWLNNFGFTPNTLVMLTSELNEITLTALEKDPGYDEACRLVRANKGRLIQVSEKKGTPMIGFTGKVIDRAGFNIDEMVTVKCGDGTIKLQKFDKGLFGF